MPLILSPYRTGQMVWVTTRGGQVGMGNVARASAKLRRRVAELDAQHAALGRPPVDLIPVLIWASAGNRVSLVEPKRLAPFTPRT